MSQLNYPISTTQLSTTASGTTITSGNTQSATFVVARTMVRTGLAAAELLAGSRIWKLHYVISAMATPYEMRLKLQRRDSGGTVQSESGYTTVRTGTGTFDDDLTWDSGTWNANDQLALVWEHRRPSGTGNKSGTMDANGASSITAPTLVAGAVVDPITFAPVVNSLRKPVGQINDPITVGIVTAGTVSSPTRGVVSWASFETPPEVTVVSGAVASPFTFGEVTNGIRTAYGKVDDPSTFGTITASRLDAKAAVAAPVAFGTVSNGVRTVYGATASEYTFGTVTDGNVENRGLVSWAALEVPAAAPVDGAVDFVITDGITTNGVRTVYGSVDNPTTFGVVTNGTTAGGGAVSVEETFTVVTAATVGMRSTVSATETFSAATSGRVTARSAVAVGITASTVTNSLRTVYGAVVLPETFAVFTQAAAAGAGSVSLPVTLTTVSAGRVTARSAVSLTVTSDTVTNSTRTSLGTVVSPFTLTVTTGQRVSAVGRVVLPVALNVTTSQRATLRSAVDEPISYNVTTSGTQAGFITAAVSQQFTFATVTNAVVTRYASVALPVTFTVTSSSFATKTGSTATALTFGTVASGVTSRFGAVSLPIIVGLETRGNKEGNVTGRTSLEANVAITTTPWLLARGRVDQPITFTTTTGATHQAYGALSLPLVFNIKSGNPIYEPGINGHIAFTKRGIARRPNTGRIANARVRSLA